MNINQISIVLRSLAVLLLCFPIYGQRKIQELEDLSRRGVIFVQDEAFYENYVVKGPREYDLVVLFVSGHPKHQCRSCSNVLKEFQYVAESYHSLKGYHHIPDSLPQLFFLVADYSKAEHVYEQHQVNTVPLMAYIPLTVRTKDIKLTAESPSYFSRARTAEDMSQFIQSRSKIHITIERSSLDYYLKTAIILYTTFIVGNAVLKYHESFKKKPVWIIICFTIIAISVSGSIYSIIRGSPPFYIGPHGFFLFHPQPGQQFVIEGWLMAAAYFCCSFMIFCLCRVVPYMKRQDTRNMGVLACACGFFFAYQFVSAIYGLKNPWYRGR